MFGFFPDQAGAERAAGCDCPRFTDESLCGADGRRAGDQYRLSCLGSSFRRARFDTEPRIRLTTSQVFAIVLSFGRRPLVLKVHEAQRDHIILPVPTVPHEFDKNRNSIRHVPLEGVE